MGGHYQVQKVVAVFGKIVTVLGRSSPRLEGHRRVLEIVAAIGRLSASSGGRCRDVEVVTVFIGSSAC